MRKNEKVIYGEFNDRVFMVKDFLKVNSNYEAELTDSKTKENIYVIYPVNEVERSPIKTKEDLQLTLKTVEVELKKRPMSESRLDMLNIDKHRSEKLLALINA